jgi:hypothetical protein
MLAALTTAAIDVLALRRSGALGSLLISMRWGSTLELNADGSRPAYLSGRRMSTAVPGQSRLGGSVGVLESGVARGRPGLLWSATLGLAPGPATRCLMG